MFPCLLLCQGLNLTLKAIGFVSRAVEFHFEPTCARVDIFKPSKLCEIGKLVGNVVKHLWIELQAQDHEVRHVYIISAIMKEHMLMLCKFVSS